MEKEKAEREENKLRLTLVHLCGFGKLIECTFVLWLKVLWSRGKAEFASAVLAPETRSNQNGFGGIALQHRDISTDTRGFKPSALNNTPTTRELKLSDYTALLLTNTRFTV